MKLLIDAGNTRIKLAAWSAPDGRARDVLSLAHEDIPTVLPGWLAAQQAPFRQACGVNVAGTALGQRLTATLADAACTLAWLKPTASALGLQNGYDTPEQLGADRWAALLGIWHKHRQSGAPLLLATFGTATTIDAIHPDGRFLGGLILPGAAMMRRSLAQGTAQLPLASGDLRPFPTNTHDAISSGMAAAQAGAVLRQWLTLREHCRATPQLFVSGGNWPQLAGEVEKLLQDLAQLAGLAPIVPQAVPHAVLDGLAYLAGHACLPATPQTAD
ncbi:type III pantothenate kinase [Kerstersia similis]|uniref:type III pantothenate kinase n=1 Tax=Kerstersia similis TaxID=206505 RepID=UPI0039F09062